MTGNVARLEDLLTVEVGDDDLGGRDEPEILLRVPIEVVTELRQVAGADQAFAPHHRRRVDLGVAVVRDVEVEHPRDERPLQARTGAVQHVEARARHLRAALEVDDAERLADLPMRLRREVEGARRPDLAHHHIRVLVGSDRHVRVRQVRNLEHPRFEARLDLGDDDLGGGDLVAEPFGRGDRPFALGRVLDGADLLRRLPALGFQGLERCDGGAPLGVERQERIDLGRVDPDGREPAFHEVGLLADQSDVEHGRVVPSASGSRNVADRQTAPNASRTCAIAARSPRTSIATTSKRMGRACSSG